MGGRVILGIVTGASLALLVMLVLVTSELSRASRGELRAKEELLSSERKRAELTESYAKSQAETRKDALRAIDRLLELEAKATAAFARASDCEAEAAAAPPARPKAVPQARAGAAWLE